MPLGTVKWFNTAGMTSLADNQKINYELVEGRDGRQMAGELSNAE